MSSIILLRHGQAAFGSANYDQLTPHGEAQASATGEFFRDRQFEFTRTISGPLLRQKETARLSLAPLGVTQREEATALDEFAEAGRLLTAAEKRTGILLLDQPDLPRSELLRHYQDQIKLWSDDAVRMDGVETIVEFRQRVATWFTDITNNHEPGQRLFVSTSGGVIAAIFCETLGLSNSVLASHMWNIENCSLTAISWSDKGRALRYFNQSAHLPPSLSSGI